MEEEEEMMGANRDRGRGRRRQGHPRTTERREKTTKEEFEARTVVEMETVEGR